ncbi:uncharacterized protein LOC130685546 [Daphnia carinata]|uniref:uncharacterized protein LOC130685546 n=1 Tax=Daphnia carinata TaxID=120202 RepID=UPI00257BB99F|nr:uncharacterized protein LOC130685546 [Daphnia carinata]
MANQKIINCISNKTFHILNCAFLIVVLIFQSLVLNTYIISYTWNWDLASYFWFLGDLFLAGLFVAMSIKAYSYLSEQKLLKKNEEQHSLTPVRSPVGKSILGVLPLCYLAWICYAICLVTKVAFIFKSEIINTLKSQDVFGPQLLKFTISSSTIVFMLLVAAHHDSEKDSQRALAIKSMCTNTAFELLDSVAFLSILIIKESHLAVTYDFENFVLVFACINFFLPTIALYQYSLSDFGQLEKPLDLNGVYHLSHMSLVNIPYLAVRIYLWSGYGSDISLFVMKNIFGILWHIKDIIPDFVLLHKQCQAMRGGVVPHRKVVVECKDDVVELEQM